MVDVGVYYGISFVRFLSWGWCVLVFEFDCINCEFIEFIFGS